MYDVRGVIHVAMVKKNSLLPCRSRSPRWKVYWNFQSFLFDSVAKDIF